MHNIYGTRFYSYRQPAWWDLEGVCVFDQQLSASDALARVGHDMRYSVAPVFSYGEDGQPFEIEGQRVILRHPTSDDPNYKSMGIVSEQYVPIYPNMVTEEFDKQVGHKCETLGFLREGAVLFLSVELPDFEIGKGDKVRSYMIVKAPMTGNEALEVRVAPVRVVCENTLRLSDARATQRYAISHVSNAVQTMGHVFARIYPVAESRAKALEQAYSAMGAVKLSRADAIDLTTRLYPMPPMPASEDEVIPEQMRQAAMKRWAGQKRSRDNRTNAIMDLWDGKVTGGSLPSMNDTVWRWYSAATELENYSWFSTRNGRASSVLDGSRGQRMATAFELAVDHLEAVGAFEAEKVFIR